MDGAADGAMERLIGLEEKVASMEASDYMSLGDTKRRIAGVEQELIHIKEVQETDSRGRGDSGVEAELSIIQEELLGALREIADLRNLATVAAADASAARAHAELLSSTSAPSPATPTRLPKPKLRTKQTDDDGRGAELPQEAALVPVRDSPAAGRGS